MRARKALKEKNMRVLSVRHWGKGERRRAARARIRTKENGRWDREALQGKNEELQFRGASTGRKRQTGNRGEG